MGDSAVGKTKLVERFLMDEYNPQQLSTYALTMFRKNLDIDGKNVKVDIWDTAGQERFNKMHPAYYHRAHACILCFDVTRKATYQHLGAWYDEMRDACENIPCILVANKIDIDYQVTKELQVCVLKKHSLLLYAAADGTNVVKVFRAAVESALDYKDNSGDFMNEAYKLLDDARQVGSAWWRTRADECRPTQIGTRRRACPAGSDARAARRGRGERQGGRLGSRWGPSRSTPTGEGRPVAQIVAWTPAVGDCAAGRPAPRLGAAVNTRSAVRCACAHTHPFRTREAQDRSARRQA